VHVITSCFTGENKSYHAIFPATIMNAGHYYCQIENQYGVVNSAIATVTVTSQTAKHPSKNIGFTYSQLTMEKSENLVSYEGLTMSQMQHSTHSADLES